MKVKGSLILLFCLVSLLLPHTVYAQSTVEGDIGSPLGFYTPDQRASFYAAGRYWVFYTYVNPVGVNDQEFYFESSTDAITWGNKTQAATVTTHDNYASVFFDDTYVHCVYTKDIGGAVYSMMYRRGVPNTDGTITWSTAEQTVLGSGATGQVYVSADTNGYPWICYPVANRVWVTKSSANDGTWAHAASFPYQLSGTLTTPEAGIILPLTSGRMIALYTGSGGETIRSQRWNGTWSAERATTTNSMGNFYYSAVAQDDNVHLVMGEWPSTDIEYERYDYSINAWTDNTAIATGATSTTVPVISRTNLNDLYVFIEDMSINNDKIYYIKYNYYGSSWEAAVELVDETVLDGLPVTDDRLNCDYNPDYDKVGVYYVSDPQKLKYKDVAELASVATLPPTAVTSTSATLRGEVTTTGTGSITTRGCRYNTSPSAAGAGYSEETGTFGAGVYSFPITDFEADELYYCQAYATNSEGTSYGEWIGFFTTQGDPTSPWNPVGNETLVPVPSEPGTWFNPSPDTGPISSTWIGSILNPFLEASGFPVEFLWWVIFILLLEIVGIAAYGVGKHTLVVFIAGSLILGFICSVSLIDWWLIFVYVSVGIPYLILESRRY